MKNNITVGDYDADRGDRHNIDHQLGRPLRDPNGPNPNQNLMVRCSKCGQEYEEHFVKFKNRGGYVAWYCKNKTCDGKNIGGDINYI